jgi:hypothetical protein
VTQCSILIVDTGPLKTLAYAGQLDLLLKPGLPVLVTDMVLEELRAKNKEGNIAALKFLEDCLGKGTVEEYSTGVPQKIEKYRELGLDPGDESIKVCLKRLAAKNDDDYVLLLFEDNDLAKNAFLPVDNVYLLTTRPFLQRLEALKYVESAENVLREAERKSMASDDARVLLGRKREHDVAPRRDPRARPF